MLTLDKSQLPSSFAGPARRRNLVSLTPLIDVVFILLIFFMLVSNFMDWHAISLSTAEHAGSTDNAELLPIVVEFDQRGLQVAGELFELPALVDHLAGELSASPQRPVLIRPAQGIVVQDVVTVLDRLTGAGISGISLLPEVAEGGL